MNIKAKDKDEAQLIASDTLEAISYGVTEGHLMSFKDKVDSEIKKISWVPHFKDDKIVRGCLSRLIAENIPIPLDTILYDNPTEGVYIFCGKDINGKNVAFDFHHNESTDTYIPCLTIDSKVIFYNTCLEMTTDWHKHDMIKFE